MLSYPMLSTVGFEANNFVVSYLLCSMETVDISIAYLEAVRDGDSESVEHHKRRLSELDENVLIDDISGSTDSIVFWCNIYNAFVRELIRSSEPTLTSSLTRLRFFNLNRINIAGHSLSLQSIEHDILRKGQFSFGLGYLPKPIISSFKRRAQPNTLDERIHFLLNCGAESCPLIRVLNSDSYDEQADEASSQYLDREITDDNGQVTVPRLFAWYRGDFGGKSGIRDFVNTYTETEVTEQTTINFNSYNWKTVIETTPFQN